MTPLADNEFLVRPGETVLVGINYRPQLAASEVISAAGTWTIPTGVTEDATYNDDDSCSIQCTVGALAGYVLELKNETTSDAGNDPEGCIYLRVEECKL